MKQKPYGRTPLNSHLLDAIMNFNFPNSVNAQFVESSDLEDYESICLELHRIFGEFPNVSMLTIEQYFEEIMQYLPFMAREGQLNYNDRLEVSKSELLEVIIFAGIHEDEVEQWECRITNKKLLELGEKIRDAIEAQLNVDGWETDWKELGQIEMDDMDETDPTWRTE